MHSLPQYFMVCLVCYMVGGIPFGLLLGKLNGIDVRLQGSGNIGATNVGRCCGKSWGVFCFLLDFCKGAIPVFVAVKISDDLGLTRDACGILAAVGTVCGHIFCPYLRFRGGKGIATSAGALFMLAPLAVVAAFAVWGLTLAIWRYVGLSSVCAAASMPIAAIAIGRVLPKQQSSTAIIVMLACISALAIYRHKTNIKRLLNGTEPKIGQAKDAGETTESHENSSA